MTPDPFTVAIQTAAQPMIDDLKAALNIREDAVDGAISAMRDRIKALEAKVNANDDDPHPTGTIVKDGEGDIWTKGADGWELSQNRGRLPTLAEVAKHYGTVTVQPPVEPEPDEITIEPGMWIRRIDTGREVFVVGFDLEGRMVTSSTDSDNTYSWVLTSGEFVLIEPPHTPEPPRKFTARKASE